jgi:DNA invertase Pin-like site-specific DNA recombinase
MPNANKFTITLLAAVAEQERDWISERTKAGLAAAKRRGTKLGNPRLDKVRSKGVAANQAQAKAFAVKFAPVLEQIQKAGVKTLHGIAECLNARGFKTRAGKEFTRQAVAKIFSYLK